MKKSSEFAVSSRTDSKRPFERIATALGWFSVALGAAEILAPGTLADLIGIRNDTTKRTMLRSPLFGMREVAAGAGILAQGRNARWVWARVAGDVVDLGTLGAALSDHKNDRRRVKGALIAVAGVTALDILTATQLSHTNGSIARFISRGGRSSEIRKSIWVNKSPEEAYSFWHDFENLPRFMHHLESVQSIGEDRTRWRARGPMGRTFEWVARLEKDQPNRLIAWRSLDRSDISNSGSVFFERAPGGRGTIVHVEMKYERPGGLLGAGVAKLLGKEPGQMLEDNLRAFKQVIETGEVIQSDASIHETMHPGRPSRRPHEMRTA